MAAPLKRFFRSRLWLSFRPRTVMRSRLRCSLPRTERYSPLSWVWTAKPLRPTVGAWYESGPGFAARPPAKPSEWDRWKESGAVTSRPNACGFLPVTRVVLPDVPAATDRVADKAVRREPALLVQRS